MDRKHRRYSPSPEYRHKSHKFHSTRPERDENKKHRPREDKAPMSREEMIKMHDDRHRSGKREDYGTREK